MGAVQFVYLLARILSPETVQCQRVHLELLGAVTLDFQILRVTEIYILLVVTVYFGLHSKNDAWN